MPLRRYNQGRTLFEGGYYFVYFKHVRLLFKHVRRRRNNFQLKCCNESPFLFLTVVTVLLVSMARLAAASIVSLSLNTRVCVCVRTLFEGGYYFVVNG